MLNNVSPQFSTVILNAINNPPHHVDSRRSKTLRLTSRCSQRSPAHSSGVICLLGSQCLARRKSRPHTPATEAIPKNYMLECWRIETSISCRRVLPKFAKIESGATLNANTLLKKLNDVRRIGLCARFAIATWRLAYTLEESRQNHASLGHLWRQAACCVALSFFRIVGGRT